MTQADLREQEMHLWRKIKLRVCRREAGGFPWEQPCEPGFVAQASTLTWPFSGVKQEEGPPITARINICLKGKLKSSHWDHVSVLLGTGMESPCSKEHFMGVGQKIISQG